MRAGIIAGRDVDNTIFRFFTSPVLPVPDPDRRQQFVHTDDVARFTAAAAADTRAGAVNITGDGSLTMREIATIIGRPLLRVPERTLRSAIAAAWRLGVSELAPGEIGGLLHMPIVDTTRLREEWNFECAWSSADALRDMARAGHGVVTLGKSTIRLPWRFTPGTAGYTGRLRALMLRRTYAEEIEWLNREIRAVRGAGSMAGDAPANAAQRALLADLATHGEQLARLGRRCHVPSHLIERAAKAGESAAAGEL